MAMTSTKSRDLLILLLISVFALSVRLFGRDWDQGHHLHPDERFLTMVANDATLPKSLGQYLDPKTSPLNPYNINFSFFVYGTLPVTLNKLWVQFAPDHVRMEGENEQRAKADSYGQIRLWGRFLSAIYDTTILIFLWLIVAALERPLGVGKNLKHYAALFYAVAVLPIQNAHYFTVDAPLVMFAIGSVYFAIREYYQRRLLFLILSAVLFGASLGCKVNAVFLLPVLLFLVLIPENFTWSWRSILKLAYPAFLRGCVYGAVAYLSLRFADPHFFADANFFNIRVSPQFLANLAELQNQGKNPGFFPPAMQWIDKPHITFALVNIILYGLGIPYFIFTAIGFFLFIKPARLNRWLFIGWMLLLFIYQSSQFAKTMRYFYLLYPIFAFFAALAFNRMIGSKFLEQVRTPLLVVAVLAVLFWPVSFMAIYTRDHSRYAASKWINENIPEGSVLAEEHWDDGLPIPLPGGKQYTNLQMPVFHPDDAEKWRIMGETLARADYIIFTSNRGYGSVGKLPTKYPKMAPFYWELFDGKSNFKLLKEFTSFPTLNLGIFRLEIDDQEAEEAFTVYDHPKVTIFKRQ